MFSQEELGRVVPLALHGDKGRGYLKLPIFNFSFESVHGLPKDLRDRSARAGDKRRSTQESKLQWSCGKRNQAQMCPDPNFRDDACPKRRRLSFDDHNGRGHVFMTRFLGTAVPSKMFKANTNVIPAYLEELSSDLSSLFNEGVNVSGQQFFGALVGVKGDLEFQVEITKMTRSYANVGTVREREFCPDCRAGSAGVPAMGFQAVPVWTRSLFMDEPWEVLPPLNKIPFSTVKRTSLYRRDCFHILKYGFLKDLCAGAVMYLGQLGYFDSEGDSVAIDNRLSRAYNLFHLWCIAEGKSTTLRKFSRGTFHREKATKFPFVGGKGADTIVMLQWLEWFIQLQMRDPKDPSHMELLCMILETSQGALSFTGIYHSHPMFLPRCCVELLLASGYRLLRGYAALASRCIQEGRRFFNLRPKVHYFQHVLWDLQCQMAQGHTRILNYPALFNNEANEDFIGRVSRISRRVSPRMITRRTIDRYLVACKLLFKRAKL